MKEVQQREDLVFMILLVTLREEIKGLLDALEEALLGEPFVGSNKGFF